MNTHPNTTHRPDPIDRRDLQVTVDHHKDAILVQWSGWADNSGYSFHAYLNPAEAHSFASQLLREACHVERALKTPTTTAE